VVAHPEVLVQLRDILVADAESLMAHRRQSYRILLAPLTGTPDRYIHVGDTEAPGLARVWRSAGVDRPRHAVWDGT